MAQIPAHLPFEVRKLDGRDFQQFSVENGIYCVPYDDEERILDFHEVLKDFLSGTLDVDGLFLPPNVSPTSVLDCGSGSECRWVDDVLGDENYEVDDAVAVDIAFPRPDEETEYYKKRWNLNVAFGRDHAELRRDKYDLVNSRFVADGIDSGRWQEYVVDLRNRLKLGGWVQMIEADLNIQSYNGSALQYLPVWWNVYSQALADRRLNKNPRAGSDLWRLVWNAGFRNINQPASDRNNSQQASDPMMLPIGEWYEDDPFLREIGRRMVLVANQTLESVGLWPCREVGGMDSDAYKALIKGCREEIENPSLKLYMRLYVVWGQNTGDENPYVPPTNPPAPGFGPS